MSQSPFKFLDAYEREDREIFFGREQEVETLYQMSFHARLMLVYGKSGTGKTSLIQCGLANCFDESDWFEIFIRRQENINQALLRELKARDKDKAFEPGYTIPQMLHSLYLDNLRPIYLIFDQFEELFILGTEEEQNQFVQLIADILETELVCKIIIATREEYLAHLSTFEKSVPSLFDHRLRVERMNRANAIRVIEGTAANPRFNIKLAGEEVADAIIDNVTEGIGRVQLPYLQVFLDKMYRMASAKGQSPVLFDTKLVEEIGLIQDVLVDFLEEQLTVFSQEVAGKEEALRWLKVFVSDKGTKVPVSRSELHHTLQDLTTEEHQEYLLFFVNRRILRPLDNDQYELTHDSIARKLYRSEAGLIKMPKRIKSYDLPANPFLRFEPYSKEMAQLFFGRDQEIQELFDMVVNETQIRTTLVFGSLGVGKTSLILAGLIPRLEVLFPIGYVQCNRELLMTKEVQELIHTEPDRAAVPLLFQLTFSGSQDELEQGERKVIILDQFEEWFIWIQVYEDRLHLYQHIAHVLESGYNCDLILVVRDEFFSQMQDLELYVPGILEEQLRIKHVDRSDAFLILSQTLDHAELEIEDEEVLERILQNVSEEDGKVNLTYLQIYMDRLYREAMSSVS